MTIHDKSNLFDNKGTFNEDISNWDVSSVTTFDKMFWYVLLSQFTVISITGFLRGAAGRCMISYNSHISNMSSSLSICLSVLCSIRYAYQFDSDLSNWDTSSAVDMQWMFG